IEISLDEPWTAERDSSVPRGKSFARRDAGRREWRTYCARGTLVSDASATSAADCPVDQQHDHRADDGTDDPRRLQVAFLAVLMEQGVAEETADKRSDDSEQDRAENANGVAPRHQKSSEGARDQPDDDEPNDEAEHEEPPLPSGRVLQCPRQGGFKPRGPYAEVAAGRIMPTPPSVSRPCRAISRARS